MRKAGDKPAFAAQLKKRFPMSFLARPANPRPVNPRLTPSDMLARAEADKAQKAKAAEIKHREESYDIAGGLHEYIACIESIRADELAEAGTKSLGKARANKRADDCIAWAHQHAATLAQWAYLARVDAAVTDYRAWLASADGDPRDPRFDWPHPGFTDLRGMATAFFFERTTPTEKTRALRYLAWRKACEEFGCDVGTEFDADPVDVENESYEPAPKPWVIGQDHHWLVPLNLTEAAAEALARKWRDSTPHFQDQEVVVFLPAGELLCFAVWSAEEIWDRPYLAKLSGNADEPRFVPVKYPWHAPDHAIHLPSPHAAPAALSTATERAATATPGARLVTGLAALDGLFRGGAGVPYLTRVLLTGDPSNCKTQALLEFAEVAAQDGWHVLWVSVDDDPSLIDIRRLQRAGLDDVRAGERRPEDVAKLDPHVEVINDRYLETAWEVAWRRAADAGRTLLVLADSMHSLGLCAAAEGKADRGAIEAQIAAVIECQRRWPATFVGTSEVTANGTPKGSRDLEYKFDVRLRLRLTGEALSITVEKNKPGRPGTVGTKVAAAVDFMGQRLLDPAAAARATATAGASAELRGQIVAAVEAHGPVLSGAKIELHVTAQGERTRAEIRAMVADGALLKAPKGYRLP